VNFSEKDILYIKDKGLSVDEVEEQIEIFKRGNLKVNIVEAATVEKGISRIEGSQKDALIQYYEEEMASHSILKLVPASGAASRMFKALHNFTQEFDPGTDSLKEYLDAKGDEDLQRFFAHMDQLPFYSHAVEKAKSNHEAYSNLSHDEQYAILSQTILDAQGLYLGNLPKGLVPFHRYETHTATAFEEHLYEASQYVTVDGVARVHFTVAEGDQEKFEAEWSEIRERVEKATGGNFEIEYSFQDPATDTVAVTKDLEPFRTMDDTLFFRPGGHGALIENLNKLDTDIVFIKNIDNVVVEDELPVVIDHKKLLGGKLLKTQSQIFEYLHILDKGNVPHEKLDEMQDFLRDELCVGTGAGGDMFVENIKHILQRPLRVCGMVRNEGEPGGGPFLVKDKDGNISLQIIEGAQIDHENQEQVKIAREATHFNPVDIVCGLKDHLGKSYDLHAFVDKEMSFIADKTKDGKELKALERPGLWNGGMARWNTVFVEVPVETFNPVKTVSDLLKESHQAG